MNPDDPAVTGGVATFAEATVNADGQLVFPGETRVRDA